MGAALTEGPLCRRAPPDFDSPSGALVRNPPESFFSGAALRLPIRKDVSGPRLRVEARALPAGTLSSASSAQRALGPVAHLPHPAGELAGGRDVGDAGPLAPRPEGGVPGDEAGGAFVAPAPDGGVDPGAPGGLGGRRAGGEVPGGLDQGAPGGGVARLGYAAPRRLLAARVPRGTRPACEA